MKWIRKNPLVAALLGVVALIAVVGSLSRLGSDSSATTTAALVTQETVGSTAAAEAGAVERSEVAPVNCGPLITLEEVDEAFDMVGQNAAIFQFTGGETCTHVLADDEDFYVEIGSGDPTDFEPSAELSGVSGEAVTGVGDGARWFTGAEDGVGVLSVQQLTLLGVLHYGVIVSRPGLAGSEQLEILRTLALAASAGSFRGRLDH